MSSQIEPAGSLREWAGARAEEFSAVAQKLDADAALARRALDEVRRFIVERKLILYGGLAIDYALRLRGGGADPPHKIPDYDFFSPRSVEDAYALADRLAEAGFENVGAIPAIHVQTMRVSVDFIYVADISYAPPAVFERMPTIPFAGMRVLHPDYQRLDMHLAFCFPYAHPPREDIFHRYPKDLRRFRLFQGHFPIAAGGALGRPLLPGPAPPEKGRAGEPPAGGPAGDPPTGGAAGPPAAIEASFDPARAVLHGFAAYALIVRALGELRAAAHGEGVGPSIAARADALLAGAPAPPPLTLEARPRSGGDGRRLRLRLTPPAADARLVLASAWPEEVAADLAEGAGGGVEWYAPYMDARPRMARVARAGAAPIDVFSTHGRLLATALVDGGGDAGPVPVVSPQYLLLHFLHEAFAAGPGPRQGLYSRFYAATLALLEAGGVFLAALRREGGGPAAAAAFRALVVSSPFGLPVRPFGGANLSASYLARLARSARAVGDSPPGLPPSALPDLSEIPPRYYPGSSHAVGERPRFDYSSNPAFQQDGGPLTRPSVPPGRGSGRGPGDGVPPAGGPPPDRAEKSGVGPGPPPEGGPPPDRAEKSGPGLGPPPAGGPPPDRAEKSGVGPGPPPAGGPPPDRAEKSGPRPVTPEGGAARG
jgi:hypothetical protein